MSIWQPTKTLSRSGIFAVTVRRWFTRRLLGDANDFRLEVGVCFFVLSRQQTAYRIKHGLLDDYLFQQLKNPSVKMRFA